MAILLPRWLDLSCQVRLQMCLKFCMVKIAIFMGSPNEQYNFDYYEGSRSCQGLDLVELGRDGQHTLPWQRNIAKHQRYCTVRLGSPYNLRFLPYNFLDTSAAGFS